MPAEHWHVKSMLRCLVNTYENERAEAIGPKALKEIRAAMVSQGWSRGYVNVQVSRLRRMYKWLVEEELLPVAVYQALCVVSGLRRGKTTARETDPVLPVADDIVEKTLPHLPEVIADMARVQRLTGMRPGEVCILRPCDIDRSGDIWLYRPEKHKTQHRGRERIVFIGAEAQEILLRYLARDSKAYCFSPRDSEAKRRIPRGRAYSPVEFAERYHVGVYRRAVYRACLKADVAPWKPNQLRHAAATEVRRKHGLEAAQVYLGHKNANVTQIYAEKDIALGIKVALG
jgi:integrase